MMDDDCETPATRFSDPSTNGGSDYGFLGTGGMFREPRIKPLMIIVILALSDYLSRYRDIVCGAEEKRAYNSIITPVGRGRGAQLATAHIISAEIRYLRGSPGKRYFDTCPTFCVSEFIPAPVIEPRFVPVD